MLQIRTHLSQLGRFSSKTPYVAEETVPAKSRRLRTATFVAAGSATRAWARSLAFGDRGSYVADITAQILSRSISVEPSTNPATRVPTR